MSAKIRCIHFRFTPGCVGCHEAAVERETITRVVAWLRRDRVVHEYSNTQDVADAIERGAWKEDER